MARPVENYTRNLIVTGKTEWNSTCASCDFDHSVEQDCIAYRKRFHRDDSRSGRRLDTKFLFPTTYYAYGYTCNIQPQGYYGQYREDICPPGSPCMRSTTIYENGYGISQDYSDWPDPPSWMVDTANSKALLKLKNQKVNLAVAFAEREETADLFSSAVRRIAAGVSAYRKRKSTSIWNQIKQEGTRNGKGHYRAIPQDWLELQYGWNPLMADVQGSASALSDRDKDQSRYHAHVQGSVKSTDSRSWNKSTLMGTFPIHDETEYHSKTDLFYALDNPLLVAFSALGLTNPAEVVWERLKYSFVIDWFLPVGNWLSTFDADFGWKFLAGANTCFSRTKGRGSWFPPKDTGPFNNFGSVDDYRFDSFSLIRTAYDHTPGVGTPHFKNPFSAGHVANALSLLVQAFR